MANPKNSAKKNPQKITDLDQNLANGHQNSNQSGNFTTNPQVTKTAQIAKTQSNSSSSSSSNQDKDDLANLDREIQEIGRQMIHKIPEINQRLDQEMGLFLPPEVTSDHPNYKLWQDYFSVLRDGYSQDLVKKEDSNEFLRLFYQTPDSAKKEAIYNLSQQIEQKRQESIALSIYWERQEIEEILEKELAKIPEELHIPYSYVFYLILSGEEFNEEAWHEFWDEYGKYYRAKNSPQSEEEIRQNIINATQKYQGRGGLKIGQSSSIAQSRTVSLNEIQEIVEKENDYNS